MARGSHTQETEVVGVDSLRVRRTRDEGNDEEAMSQRYVYFFQNAEGFVKIGQSANPAARCKMLSYEAGHRLKVVGVMASEDSLVEERAIQRACAEHHFEREWFRPGALQTIEGFQHRFLEVMPEPPQRLVQTSVSEELYKALAARAKSEKRSIANFIRHELSKSAPQNPKTLRVSSKPQATSSNRLR